MQFLPQTFFLCHKLKTGGIALGWIGVFVSLPSWWFLTELAASTRQDLTTFDILIGGTIGGILCILANAYLIYGSKKEKWNCCVFWLVYGIVEVAVALPAYYKIITIIKVIPRHLFIDNISTWLLFMTLTVYLVIFIYCWLCVLSLTRNLYQFSSPEKPHLQDHRGQDPGLRSYGDV